MWNSIFPGPCWKPWKLEVMCVVFEVNSVCLCVGGGIGKVFKGPNQSELPQQCSHKLCCSILQATHTYITFIGKKLSTCT